MWGGYSQLVVTGLKVNTPCSHTDQERSESEEIEEQRGGGDAVKREERDKSLKLVHAGVFCTSYKAANSQPVYKHIVNELVSCKQFSYHIQIGSDRSGCI